MPCSDYRSTLTETGGPTELGIGVIVDGEYLVRVGDEITSTPAGSGSTLPEGMIALWSTPVAPPGWLLCDGSVVSQATYPALYGRITSTFDIGGEGAGNFRLPNFNNRFPKGLNGAESIGGTGGSQTPSVSVTDPGHQHTVGNNATRQVAGGGANTTAFGTTAANTTGITASIADGRPPFLIIYFIIKT